jgi:hypothetical protein
MVRILAFALDDVETPERFFQIIITNLREALHLIERCLIRPIAAAGGMFGGKSDRGIGGQGC